MTEIQRSSWETKGSKESVLDYPMEAFEALQEALAVAKDGKFNPEDIDFHRVEANRGEIARAETKRAEDLAIEQYDPANPEHIAGLSAKVIEMRKQAIDDGLIVGNRG